ncbi:NucA/NucB deoxyribonuclease domain-containing protein [Filimonas effusa]|uniref:Deoxyribonuclease NucA/NucB domain-containing protein n=1 Tax=Filimonas effusa TaxID=2508721 RepID=A0A4Q1DCE7_9BACT|nr:NucA/NucB deoxyribonuclease domain-containing protein [Filimonas effusa]RXK86628.1 hypothetical protein ESB13_07440 [Filimonas effusa]
MATLENGTLDGEKRYYDILTTGSRVTAGSVHYPYADGNSYVESLNGNSNKTGTSILLKVMAGDKVNIAADSWYERSPSSGDVSSLPVGELLSTLAGGISGAGGGSHSAAQLLEDGNLKNGLTSFLVQKADADYPNNGAGKPKAYLNYVLFDEQLNAVISDDGNNSGVSGVGDEGKQTPVGVSERLMTRNGYLYIFVSNETRGTDVVFDNLQVTHIRGPLCEETHYYPFGLTMAGISSRAAGKLQNKRKYNGIEYENSFDVNIGEAFFRTHDPQLGRWWQIDPKPSHSESPYSAMSNNPILNSDPLGDKDSTANKPKVVPVPIPEKLFPNIYKNLMASLANGKPMVITYDSNRQNARRRRREALKNTPPRPGYDRDEYPYASTKEGGKGADVNYVPSSENKKHGGLLGALVVLNKMETGDQFEMVPIPNSPEPETSPSPAPSPAPAANQSLRDRIGKTVGLTGVALTVYIIISEGSRLFPPRNLVPIP